jgi:hypothetical protein
MKSVLDTGAMGFTATVINEGEQGSIRLEWTREVKGNADFQMAQTHPDLCVEVMAETLARHPLSRLQISTIAGLLVSACMGLDRRSPR